MPSPEKPRSSDRGVVTESRRILTLLIHLGPADDLPGGLTAEEILAEATRFIAGEVADLPVGHRFALLCLRREAPVGGPPGP